MVNSAGLLLLVSQDPESYTISFGLVGGSVSDFNKTWFKVIGNTLTGAMIITTIMPLIEATVDFLVRLFERSSDRGCSRDRYRTKQQSI